MDTTQFWQMLGTAALRLIGAFLVLAVAVVIGRMVGDLVANLLQGLGFDNILVSLGLARSTAGRLTPSRVVGAIVMIAIVLLAT